MLVFMAASSAPAPSTIVPVNGYPGLHCQVARNVDELGWSRERLEAAKAEAAAAGSAAGMIVTKGQVVAVVVTLMNTDVEGPRRSSSGWDRLLGAIRRARLDSHHPPKQE
jgi:hypothetical protein